MVGLIIRLLINWAKIHHARLSQFSLLVEFFLGEVPVKDQDRRVLKLVNLDHGLFSQKRYQNWTLNPNLGPYWKSKPCNKQTGFNHPNIKIQWGLEYRTFEYRIHSNTERFHVLYWDGSVFEWSV